MMDDLDNLKMLNFCLLLASKHNLITQQSWPSAVHNKYMDWELNKTDFTLRDGEPTENTMMQYICKIFLIFFPFCHLDWN